MGKPGSKQLDPGLLTSTAHGSVNHAGLPGVGDLTTAAHASLDHSSIPGAGKGFTVWFDAFAGVGAGIFLTPYGRSTASSSTFRAPRAGTLNVAVFDGNTSSVDFIINVGGNSYNTGFVSDGAVVNPNLSVAQGDKITIQINTIGSGSYAAWTLFID